MVGTYILLVKIYVVGQVALIKHNRRAPQEAIGFHLDGRSLLR